MSGTVTIGGVGYNAQQWPKANIVPSIQWAQDSGGYWNGSDRGASQDIYESTVTFLDKESVINALNTALDANRQGITLSGFSYPVFSPNVDHTGSVSAAILDVVRKQVKWGYPGASAQLYTLEVSLRAISPTILSTTPSLSTLKLQDNFEAGNDYTSRSAFSYTQAAYYADTNSDIGTFKGTFRQTEPQLKAILAYLLGTARATAFAFPNIGVAYPFGNTQGAYTTKNCVAKSLQITRANTVFWNLNLELVEAP